ncbi:MAG: hypothetical protein R3C68_05535 [Myxococcota bacterium]
MSWQRVAHEILNPLGFIPRERFPACVNSPKSFLEKDAQGEEHQQTIADKDRLYRSAKEGITRSTPGRRRAAKNRP